MKDEILLENGSDLIMEHVEVEEFLKNRNLFLKRIRRLKKENSIENESDE